MKKVVQITFVILALALFFPHATLADNGRCHAINGADPNAEAHCVNNPINGNCLDDPECQWESCKLKSQVSDPAAAAACDSKFQDGQPNVCEADPNCGYTIIPGKKPQTSQPAGGNTSGVVNGRGKCPGDDKHECIILENPLQGDPRDAATLIGTIIRGMLGIMGSVALIMFVWGASSFVTSAGNAEKISSGTKSMVFSALGVFVVFASYIVLGIVMDSILGNQPKTSAGAPVTSDGAGTATESCKCVFTIDMPNCTANASKDFSFTQTATVGDLFSMVSSQDCPLKDAQTPQIDLAQGITVTKENCANVAISNADPHYSVSCSVISAPTNP